MKAEPVGREQPRIRLDMVLLDVPADRVDAGHALEPGDLRANDPVLHRAKEGRALDLGRQPLAVRGEVRAVGLPARPAVGGFGAAPPGCSNSTVHM